MKKLITLCGIAISIVILVLSVNLLETRQNSKPFNSNMIVEISTTNTKTDKKQLIDELNKIAENGGVYKEVASKDDFLKKRNIIWFGRNKPQSDNIIIKNNNIDWLSNDFNGKLIHSSEMGEIPLSGEYAITDNLKIELEEWANKNDIRITFFKDINLIKTIYLTLVENPIGNSLVAMYIITTMLFISYFIVKAKERAIKLLSGVRQVNIIKHDVLFLSKNMILGFLMGTAGISIYYGITKNVENLFLIFKSSLTLILLAIFILMIIAILLSAVVSPKVSHISDREIPLKRFNYLIISLKVIAILFSVSVLANTVLSATIAMKMSNEHASWSAIKNNYRLSFSELDELYEDSNVKEIERFINSMQRSNDMSISLVVDKSIEIDNELKESGFDHFVISDKAWINAMGVGINEEKINGKLKSYSFEDINPSLKKFILEQMPLLINEDIVKTQNLKFYTFEGNTIRALAPNTGDMDAFITLKNPLLVVIDNPADELKTKGFTIPALSSGNIIFSDKDNLDKSLSETAIKNYVISVDSIADLALKTAQDFQKQFLNHVFGGILLLITIIYAGVLESKLWAYKNKKKIYVMVTNGNKYFDIFKFNMKNDICLFIIVILISGVFTRFFRSVGINIIGIVIIMVTLFYVIGLYFAHRISSKKEFVNAINRV